LSCLFYYVFLFHLNIEKNNSRQWIWYYKKMLIYKFKCIENVKIMTCMIKTRSIWHVHIQKSYYALSNETSMCFLKWWKFTYQENVNDSQNCL
jgi:hypothetical protein